MAAGKIIDLFPAGNDGSQEGAGRVTPSGSSTEYVFFTPDDVDSASVPLAAGSNVTFDISGDLAINVQKN
ncbi:MAG: hypothetical protein HY841_14750 [Bacteroidetes bacterium]|nr:hypothetical protein [Bacteroidota bacterium]